MKKYLPEISASVNRKGVLDVDTVKGCSFGMAKYPNGGCYGLCYAAKISKFYGYDFSVSSDREIDKNKKQLKIFSDVIHVGKNGVFSLVKNHKMKWFRVGVMGDPSHNWQLTADLCRWLCVLKTPVIVTKHWVKIPANLINIFRECGAVFNTSISALDTKDEARHRINEFMKLQDSGIRSLLRIVSCRFGGTKEGSYHKNIQDKLFENKHVIDNPLRIPATDKRVVEGHILVDKIKDIYSKTYISIFNKKTYIGHCGNCPDQCGVL